ncbi:MAG: ATP synthase F1 subunit epsilon [Patescibacteria group bacterium]
MTLQLKIISPERTLFDEQVNQVSLTTNQGEITVLPGHISIVTTLKPGELRFLQGKEETPIAILGGFAEITDKTVIVLADAAEKIEEIVEERVMTAKKQAEELRQQKVTDREEFAALTAQIERELARLKIAEKYRKRNH